ncbi:hypothetical protein Vadar_027540 [Vaccinium darrowii]|uniref:Uncharacterized protein n=1 Tax=Vaccinium darrowii TaxID=229202 RepID=A0ACB7YGY1_9ERIC|nr:hypothetical protein Vadar_027540 [Vaccinium darrowii]
MLKSPSPGAEKLESTAAFCRRRVRFNVHVSFDALVTLFGYLYSGIARSLRPEGVYDCVDDKGDHVACRPAVDFVVEVLYASFIF